MANAPQPSPLAPPRVGRTYWGITVYLCGFGCLILLLYHFFFKPALAHLPNTDLGRRQLAADAWLLMAVLMVYLVSGLMLIFRVGRFFFPRQRAPRVKTRYTDAWAEAGRRLAVKKEEPQDGDDELRHEGDDRSPG